MNLGTQTASAINHLYGCMTIGAPEPQVGMGATLLSWTDRYPATVVEWDGKIIAVTEDDYVRTDKNGMSESQEYEFTPNPNRARQYFRREKNGSWVSIRKNEETGRWNRTECGGLIVGFRKKYHDYSF